MAIHNDTGKWGEALAADYLAAHGYAIADQNWHSGHYEIDIIAYKGARIVFVEVKTRTDRTDDPIEAVDRRKAMRLIRAAQVYIDSHKINHELQFDIIAISGSPYDYTIEHLPDAIQSPLKTY